MELRDGCPEFATFNLVQVSVDELYKGSVFAL